MNSKEIARIACEAMEDKKAQDIKIINIENVSSLADYFIVASGMNRNQVQAMADNVNEMLGKAGVEPKQLEGYQNANWILMVTEMLLFTFLMKKIGYSMIWNVFGETEKL